MGYGAQGKAEHSHVRPLPWNEAVAIILTSRDLQILDTLTRRVRVMSIQQIARTWWAESADCTRVAQNRLRALEAEGLLHIDSAPAHPELQLEEPVARWALDERSPDFGAVSYQLQSRWREHPILTSCVSASKIAANRFGGYGGRPPRAVERTHDIHMAQVFLRYRKEHPALIKHWVFEEQVKAERKRAARSAERLYVSDAGEKLPDAFLRSPSGTKVIEFGGAYGKDKLQAFHAYCKEHSFPYEIW